jgi:hypothetical protein
MRRFSFFLPDVLVGTGTRWSSPTPDQILVLPAAKSLDEAAGEHHIMTIAYNIGQTTRGDWN